MMHGSRYLIGDQNGRFYLSKEHIVRVHFPTWEKIPAAFAGRCGKKRKAMEVDLIRQHRELQKKWTAGISRSF